MQWGLSVADEDPRRCACCGRVLLLLVVFANGFVQHTRIGCSCFSVRLYPNESDQAMRARLTREYEAVVAKRSAS
jgi:hypothetical protein